jgi:hypothetical protein
MDAGGVCDPFPAEPMPHQVVWRYRGFAPGIVGWSARQGVGPGISAGATDRGAEVPPNRRPPSHLGGSRVVDISARLCKLSLI